MSNISALFTAAVARHHEQDLNEATRLYREILSLDPHHADTLHMLGIIAKQKGNHDLALKLIEAALGQHMAMPLAWYNRSVLLRTMGRNDEALQSAEQAIDFDPNLADAWDMAGILLREKKEFDRARFCHAQAVALVPDNLKYLGHYAMLLQVTGDLAEAYQTIRKVERRSPDLFTHTIGNILMAAGYPDRAVPYFEKSRHQMPDNKHLTASEAMARLQIGDFKQGWPVWEMRPNLDERFNVIPDWQGQPVDHLLLHEDQGLGDTLQCMRYIPKLRPFAKRITLQGPKFLVELLRNSYPDLFFLTYDDPVPAADARMRLLSLPPFFGTNATNIPDIIPYIKVKEETRLPWRERLAHIPKPRIGIVWGGNPNHKNDRLRSIPFASLAPILNAAGNHLISLQKGGHRENTDLSSANIVDADPLLNDFTDTAALMSELDLLISVDTATVHLAGAIGIPVWLMLPFEPDWRWFLGREDSPWYPTMRLFRQQHPHNWSPVIEQIAADVSRLRQGDTTVLKPKKGHGENLQRNPHAVKLT